MRVCKCGYTILDDATICPCCGSHVELNENDYRSVVYFLIGFLFMSVGLTLYIVWYDDMPLRAKSAGLGALIGVLLSVACAIISIVYIVQQISPLFELL